MVEQAGFGEMSIFFALVSLGWTIETRSMMSIATFHTNTWVNFCGSSLVFAVVDPFVFAGISLGFAI